MLKMENAKPYAFDFLLSPKNLRKNAKYICEEVKSNAQVLIYRCDDCGKPHIRFVYEDEQNAAAVSETIH
jgi:hypothetical protein